VILIKGNSTVTNIILVTLIIVATAASGLFYTKQNQLQTKVNSLNNQLSVLTAQKSILESQIEELDERASEYEVYISKIENSIRELELKLYRLPIESETHIGQLSLSVRLENDTVQVSNQFNITLRLKNIGNLDITLYFPTPQIFDFKILEGDKEVYKWSSDRFFIQVLRIVRLGPGETLEQTLTWMVESSPGIYAVMGSTSFFINEKPVTMQTPGLTIEVIS